ncbi:hypothetical protein OG943_30360 [Amycolatopsis sp. NBC_00345]|uniref:hypothetical protein n=1 Tax=Amycolatopsis sp. NBC_00345 TaxID=2975955 RepID=UPI002E273BF7
MALAVDLTVLGLLVRTRHLALNGSPGHVVQPARRLLLAASAATLALNAADPVFANQWGKAAFDTVGPLLLIGRAEIGPGLLQAIGLTNRSQAARKADQSEPAVYADSHDRSPETQLELDDVSQRGSEQAVAGRVPEALLYVRRQHDGDFEKVIDRALAGESGLAVLLGNSSTGKTRSAWEQVQRLPEPWRLWHPTSADELLAELPTVGPRTVLWLNELHRYLYTDDVRRDEAIASWLIEALQNLDRAPVLVLGTLWHEYRLRLAPAEITNDTRPQVRKLVTGHFIPVPETFAEVELRLLAEAAERDPRLAEAEANAEEGHVTQYLAGGPAQVERYLTADPAAQAILHAAMDARRLGWKSSLSAGFLNDAALAYFSPAARGT